MALEEPVSDISQGSLFGKMVGGIFGSRRTSAPREATGSGFASRTEMLGGSEPPSGSGDTPGPSASRLKTEQLVEGSSGARTRVPGRPNLGKILTERGVITQAQLERALEHQKESGCRLGEALEELNFCTDAQIAKALAEQLEIPFIDLEQSPPSRRFLELIPRDVALEHGVVAVRMDGNRLLVAARDPFDVRADQAIHQITGLNARLAAVPHSQLNELLLRGLREEFLGDKDDDEDEAPVTLNTFSGTAAPSYQATIQDEEVLTVEKLAQLGQQLSTVQAVDSLIAQAIRGGASDLHIKPEAEFLRIRHRVDGRLRTLVHLPSQLIPSIMARVKIMASMDISESRKPQDGSAQFGVDGRTFELRVSTLPGIYGEVAVIRVLNNDLGMRSLDGIGMDPEVEQQIRRVLGARQGMVLITGPTGSGKTTSLYASLSHLNTDEVNIITVEDPVEIKLPGVSQIQVHEKAGRGFAATLRAILRQDPDIVMLGEIRDLETGEIACRAALTGHLVLSTLHTLDTISSVWRLIEMGIPRYVVTASLNAIVAQRLIRTVCPDCAEPDHPEPTLLMAAQKHFGPFEVSGFRKGRGCTACGGSGTRGRTGVYELLVMDQEIRRMLVADVTEDELRAFLMQHGLRTMEQDAFDKVVQGRVPFSEVIHLGLSFAVQMGDASHPARSGAAQSQPAWVFGTGGPNGAPPGAMPQPAGPHAFPEGASHAAGLQNSRFTPTYGQSVGVPTYGQSVDVPTYGQSGPVPTYGPAGAVPTYGQGGPSPTNGSAFVPTFGAGPISGPAETPESAGPAFASKFINPFSSSGKRAISPPLEAAAPGGPGALAPAENLFEGSVPADRPFADRAGLGAPGAREAAGGAIPTAASPAPSLLEVGPPPASAVSAGPAVAGAGGRGAIFRRSGRRMEQEGGAASAQPAPPVVARVAAPLAEETPQPGVAGPAAAVRPSAVPPVLVSPASVADATAAATEAGSPIGNAAPSPPAEPLPAPVPAAPMAVPDTAGPLARRPVAGAVRNRPPQPHAEAAAAPPAAQRADPQGSAPPASPDFRPATAGPAAPSPLPPLIGSRGPTPATSAAAGSASPSPGGLPGQGSNSPLPPLEAILGQRLPPPTASAAASVVSPAAPSPAARQQLPRPSSPLPPLETILSQASPRPAPTAAVTLAPAGLPPAGRAPSPLPPLEVILGQKPPCSAAPVKGETAP